MDLSPVFFRKRETEELKNIEALIPIKLGSVGGAAGEAALYSAGTADNLPPDPFHPAQTSPQMSPFRHLTKNISRSCSHILTSKIEGEYTLSQHSQFKPLYKEHA